MRSYGQQFCPITRAAEIFAERWTPLIVRNLLIGCRTFGEIRQGAPGIPKALLSQRLRTLERHGVVRREPNPERRGSVYELTSAGRELQAVCDALGTWGARWLDSAPRDLDPGVLLWAISRNIDVRRLPQPVVVVRVDLADHPKERFWLLLREPEAEVCRMHPGFEEDLILRAETEWLTKWHMGDISFSEGIRRGVIEVDGLRRLARDIPKWGGQSPFASTRLAALR